MVASILSFFCWKTSGKGKLAMSKVIQGVSVRDKYPDYPKNLKDWQLWQIMENHMIGIRTALTSCGCMNHKR